MNRPRGWRQGGLATSPFAYLPAIWVRVLFERRLLAKVCPNLMLPPGVMILALKNRFMRFPRGKQMCPHAVTQIATEVPVQQNRQISIWNNC